MHVNVRVFSVCVYGYLCVCLCLCIHLVIERRSVEPSLEQRVRRIQNINKKYNMTDEYTITLGTLLAYNCFSFKTELTYS